MSFTRKNIIGMLVWILGFVSLPSLALSTDTPPFFKVEYQGKTAYLLGSVHLGTTDFYPLPTLIEQKFSQSSTLVVEAIPSEQDAELLQQYTSRYPAPHRSAPHLKSFCIKQATFCDAIQFFPPWLQATQISMLRMSQKGYRADLGIDLHFIQRAQNKQLQELESMKYQFQLLNSISKSTQWQMVTDAITTSDAEIEAMFIAWRRGELDTIAELAKSEFSNTNNNELMAKLLWSRNKHMSQKLLDIMLQHPQQHSVFVVVGAAHLAGDKSINQYLEQRGASVLLCQKNNC